MTDENAKPRRKGRSREAEANAPEIEVDETPTVLSSAETPDAHARATDNWIPTPKNRPWIPPRYSPLHQAAAVLHGWREHEHHEAGPIQITRAAYIAALDAAGQAPARPHPAAASPHCPHK